MPISVLLAVVLFVAVVSLPVFVILLFCVYAYHRPRIHLGAAWKRWLALYGITLAVDVGALLLASFVGSFSLLRIGSVFILALVIYSLYMAFHRLGKVSKPWAIALASIYPLLTAGLAYVVINVLFAHVGEA